MYQWIAGQKAWIIAMETLMDSEEWNANTAYSTGFYETISSTLLNSSQEDLAYLKNSIMKALPDLFDNGANNKGVDTTPGVG
jgi:hypothetical protein